MKSHPFTRRDFLKLAAIGGVALAIPALNSGFKYIGADSQPYETTVNAMGTTISFRIEDEIDSAAASLAVSKAAQEVRRLETLLTRFPGGSDVYTLNQTGVLQSPSSDVLAVMRESIKGSELSEGSFDVTVKPVLDMLTAYLSGQPFPSDAQFEAARSLINYEELNVEGNFASLSKQGAGVTLDGIATGYILDSAAASLRSSGIRSALINAGGTVATIGARGDGSLWEVSVSDPMNPAGTVATLHVKDMAIATSGDYEDYFTSNRAYYHVIDPRTARSPLYSHSATVVAPTAFQADPLGVTLMVDEPESGIRLADSTGVQCLLYTDGGQILTTSGMDAMM